MPEATQTAQTTQLGDVAKAEERGGIEIKGLDDGGTLVPGHWRAVAAKMSQSGNHAVVTMAEIQNSYPNQRMSVLCAPEELETLVARVQAGAVYVDPTFAIANGRVDGSDKFIPSEPLAKDTQNGRLTYWAVWFLSAERCYVQPRPKHALAAMIPESPAAE